MLKVLSVKINALRQHAAIFFNAKSQSENNRPQSFMNTGFHNVLAWWAKLARTLHCPNAGGQMQAKCKSKNQGCNIENKICSLTLSELICSQNKLVHLALAQLKCYHCVEDNEFPLHSVFWCFCFFLHLPKCVTVCTSSRRCKLASYLHRFDVSTRWPHILTMSTTLQSCLWAHSQSN